MRLWWLAAVMFIMLGTVWAGVPEVLILRDGTRITGISNIVVKPDGLMITHDGGITKAGFYSLTDEQIATYGLTRKAAEAYAAKEKQARMAAIARMQWDAVERERRRKADELGREVGIDVAGIVVEVVPGRGVLFQGFQVETYVETVEREARRLANQTTDPIAYKRMEKVQVKRERQTPLGEGEENLSFLEQKDSSLRKGGEIRARLFRIGTCSYADAQGSRRVVPLFTDDALRLLNYQHPAE